MAGAALERAMRAVRIECRRLRVAGGVDRRGYRIQAVNRLVATLTGHPLVARRVAHQARLARIVEWRLEVLLAGVAAARLDVGRRMTVRTMRLARRQPVIPAVGRRRERHRSRLARRCLPAMPAFWLWAAATQSGVVQKFRMRTLEITVRHRWSRTGLHPLAVTSIVARLASEIAGSQIAWVKSPSGLSLVGSSQAIA